MSFTKELSMMLVDYKSCTAVELKSQALTMSLEPYFSFNGSTVLPVPHPISNKLSEDSDYYS
jgi:hypothetical protein